MTQKREFINVTWANESKTKISADIIVTADDDTTQSFHAVISPIEGGINPDWEAIMEDIGVEAIDAATTEFITKQNSERDAKALADEESGKKRFEFDKQERLFASKLEVFELDVVKASTNRTLKAKIRKATTVFEVQAYTTILLMKELDNEQSSITAEAVEETPPAE